MKYKFYIFCIHSYCLCYSMEMYMLYSKIISGSRVIKSDKVFEVMSSVDRGKYTHPSHAYIDAPQGIGYGVTISAPHMV